MAKENMEFSNLVKKCKILLLDIEGTTTSISFVKEKLFPYAEENVKVFLERRWENEEVKETVAALRKQATEDQEKSAEGFVVIPGEDATKEEQIEGLVNNVKWQMAADRKVGPLKQLQGLIWNEGYDKGEIKGHVYDDVTPALEQWRSAEGQKVYIYSSGSVQAQKLLFNKSLAGDMLPLIDGHFDTAVGAKQEAASYAAIAEKIGSKAEEILFLTDIVQEAEAARSSGLQAALVSREGNAPLPAEATASFPVLHSFDQLAVTNKRKPDPQVEEIPAKVPKTDVQDDVKTTSEIETETVKANGSTEPIPTKPIADVVEAIEAMEVEDSSNAEANVDTAAVKDANIENDAPMEEAEINVDSENTAETSAITETSATEVVEEKVSIEENSTVESLVETPIVSEPKLEEVKPGQNIEIKTMVDAATATESPAVAKTVDAATETVVIESSSEQTNIEEATEKPLNSVEAQSVTEEISANDVVKTEEVGTALPTTTEEVGTALPITTEKPQDKSDATNPVEVPAVLAEPISVSNGTEVPVAVEVISDVVAEATEIVKAVTETPVDIAVEAVEGVTDQKDTVEAPATVIEPVMEEIGDKTETKETEKKETPVPVNEEIAASEPLIKHQDEPIIEETPVAIEIKDITDDKQSLDEVTETIDDVVPIVEEPTSHLEVLEELQNAGDVLEKECDEILSKVQDVTSLDYIPVKPLHTITEEMETENADSNDLVERILDTEMELSMKPEEIALNTVEEITEPKTDTDQAIDKVAEETMEVSGDAEVEKPNQHLSAKTNGDDKEATPDSTGEKMDTEEDSVPVENIIVAEDSTKTQETKTDSEIINEPTPVTNDTQQIDEPNIMETTENKGSQDAKTDDAPETKVNGKTNGDTVVKLNGNDDPKTNGDTTQDDELKARLVSENGKEKVNGSNGDSVIGEIGQGDKIEAEIPDIKVKTVATDEVRAPIEQPVEA